MPNGDPNWDLTELPKLERFFAPLAEEIREFALMHNMSIERYPHEAPEWALCFTPPQGGNAAISIRRLNDDAFVLHMGWFIDDYDAATRSLKHAESPPYRAAEVRLSDALRTALAQMLTWRRGDWSQLVDWELLWRRYTREQFDNMRPRWPKVREPKGADAEKH